MKHKIWAFYLGNGSIERRHIITHDTKGSVVASTEKEVRNEFSFDDWYGKGTILKVVPKVKEKKEEICPRNAHHHHLLNGVCPFCSVQIKHSSRNIGAKQ